MTHRYVKIRIVASAVCILVTTAATSAQTVIRVDRAATGAGDGTTWTDAYDSLQDALIAAIPPSQIWVARGTHVPDWGTTQTPGDRSASFQLKSGVEIYGGFLGTASPSGGETSLEQRDWLANVTVLTGDLGRNDGFGGAPNDGENSFHVVIAINTSAAAVLDGFTITGGHADGDSASSEGRGGGMYCDHAHPTITHCVISGNSANLGGGMFNEQSNPTITFGTFDLNTALNYNPGGGIYNRLSNPTITDVSFGGNTARFGAGMYNDGSDPIVMRCRFVGNVAEWSGGGMRNFSSFNNGPIVTECAFERNTAGRDGGGMSNIWAGSQIVTDCTFDANTANRGGGMFNNNSAATVKGCLFRRNTAATGGGIYSGHDNLGFANVMTVTDCSFVENLGGSGGGMFNDSNSTTFVTGCRFMRNFATTGGGIHNFESAAAITNCIFSLNSVESWGGGMANSNASPMVTNCTFAGNTASDLGGGIYNFLGSNPTISNSILWGDSAAMGGNEILNEAMNASLPAGNALVSHSIIRASGGSANWDAAFGTDAGGNLDANPRFIRISKHGGGDDPSTLDVHEGPDDVVGDLRLQLGSPGIDAGDTAVLPADVPDLDGDGDTLESIPFDIQGSLRVVDDPGALDTGNGGPPVVDIGAYELNPVDCNNNGVSDPQDLVNLTSLDCNANGVPDECEVDCNANGVADDCDIGTIDVDCDANGVPDMCQQDCNGNGVADTCDIAGGAADANANGVLDVCELRFVDALATGAGDGTSWVDAFTNLQDALAAAAGTIAGVPRQQIWVARGTYKPDQGVTQTPGDRLATFQLISGVKLYGGFLGTADPTGGETSLDQRDWQANVTVLSGDLGEDDVTNLPDFFRCFMVNPGPLPEGCDVLDADANGYISDEDANMDDNSSHVVTGSETDATAVLDGFTITGGSANGGIDSWGFRGGGMTTINGSPRVANCRFTENIAGFVSGGMNNERSRISVTNCTFDRNFAFYGGAIRNSDGSAPTVVGCSFRENVAGEIGGAVGSFQSATLTLQNCTFIGNRAKEAGALSIYGQVAIVRWCVFVSNEAAEYGGAVRSVGANDGSTFLSTVFSGNSSGKGGGAMYSGPGNQSIVNCTFSGNTSGLSGGAILNDGIYGTQASPTRSAIIDSTFSGNFAGEFAGAIANRNDSVTTLTNSILWGNSAAFASNEIHNDNSDSSLPVGSAIVRYSDIAGSGGSDAWDSSLGMDDGGNIDADPLFSRTPSDGGDGFGDDPTTVGVDEGLNDDFGDLQLGPGSPAIDAGDNSGVAADGLDIDNDGDITEAIPFDLAGLPRFADDVSVVDSGLSGNGHAFVVDMGAFEVDRPKNRFITLVVPGLRVAGDTAIRVKLISLLHPASDPGAPGFADSEGELRYVNRIRDDRGNVVTDCTDSAAFGTSYPCATLGCQPEYADWSGILANRAIQVTGDAIVPSSRYGVAIIPESCAGNEAACPAASPEIVVTTNTWGNVQGGGAPNVTQVVMVVDKVKDMPGQFPEYRTMLQPKTPRPYRTATKVLDITLAVDAVKGRGYPFGAPASCP